MEEIRGLNPVMAEGGSFKPIAAIDRSPSPCLSFGEGLQISTRYSAFVS